MYPHPHLPRTKKQNFLHISCETNVRYAVVCCIIKPCLCGLLEMKMSVIIYIIYDAIGYSTAAALLYLLSQCFVNPTIVK